MKNYTYLSNIKTYAFKNRNELLDFIADKKQILIAINAEKIMKKDIRLKNIINKNIGYADGSGAVFALRQKGLESTKIAGAELWFDIIKKFSHDKSFYILGATEDIIEKTVNKLRFDYPHINIVGYRDGFLDDEDKKNLIKELKDKKPSIVFIAQGSPRQEFLMDDLMEVYPALYMGLGGSFDVYTGLKKRAPKVFINLNLEWLYRLIKEPTRVSRQLVLVKFIFLLIAKKI